MLESSLKELDEILTKLKIASDLSVEAGKQSSALRDQARVLTDKYNLITTCTRDMLQALSHINDDVSAELWDSVRFSALYALKGMLKTLRDRDLLASECSPVADMIDNLPELEEMSRIQLEEIEW